MFLFLTADSVQFSNFDGRRTTIGRRWPIWFSMYFYFWWLFYVLLSFHGTDYYSSWRNFKKPLLLDNYQLVFFLKKMYVKALSNLKTEAGESMVEPANQQHARPVHSPVWFLKLC